MNLQVGVFFDDIGSQNQQDGWLIFIMPIFH